MFAIPVESYFTTLFSSLSQVRVKPSINTLVFGESAFNDGVSIVLFNLFKSMRSITIANDSFESRYIGLAVVKLLWMTIMGFLLGFVLGVLGSWLTRLSKHIPVVDPLIVGASVCMLFAFTVFALEFEVDVQVYLCGLCMSLCVFLFICLFD